MVTAFWIANQTNQALLNIVQASAEVMYREIFSAVVEGIDGEVTTDRIFLNGAVDIVAQNAAGVGEAGFVPMGFFAFLLIMAGSKGCHFNNVRAKNHMDQFEATANDTGVPKQGTHRLGGGAGGDIKILGGDSQHDVANTTAD